MDIDDIVKIHIWQLTEKDHKTIDKEADYSIIHDGKVLKKVKMKKLYDYFNQDYKAENIERYIDSILSELENKYDGISDSIIASCDKYKKWVRELESKFEENSDNLRKVIKMSGQLDNNIKSLTDIFLEIDNNYIEVNYSFDKLYIIYTEQNFIITNSKTDIENLQEIVLPMIEVLNDLFEDAEKMDDKLNLIENNIISGSENKKNELIDKINEEYDKIVSIIDHYHHIHDIPWKSKK